MKRRTFLWGTLSTATVLLTGQKGQAASLDTWRSYNTPRFEQVRQDLSQHNSRWIDVDLRRMTVTGLQGTQIQLSKGRPLLFTCDDGDVHNPTITGLFTPDSTSEMVTMSGSRRQGADNNYKEYVDVPTYYVIFFSDGYALHGLDPTYVTSGSHVSAGCVRLNYNDAQLLYQAHQQNPFSVTTQVEEQGR